MTNVHGFKSSGFHKCNNMSKRRKLEKFAALLSFPNVYEMTSIDSQKVRKSKDEILSLSGKWNEEAFEDNNPVVLELACGRGEYTVGLARRNPDTNYIGVDIKGARIHQGATIALDEKLSNVAFLRIRIEKIQQYFSHGEVSEIWITFPDPFYGKPNRRLTSIHFLDIYAELLGSNGIVHLKTDDDELFLFTVETASEHPRFRISKKSENISSIRKESEELNITTYYERQHLMNKRTIKYLQLEKID